MRVSARNKLMGEVIDITPGAVNAVVKIKLKGSPIITAVVTSEAIQEMGLKTGGQACAVIKASSVLLGTCEDGAGCGCQD